MELSIFTGDIVKEKRTVTGHSDTIIMILSLYTITIDLSRPDVIEV